MAITPIFNKDPTAILDCAVDWGQWMGADAIASATWLVPTAGIFTATTGSTVTSCVVYLTGGSVGSAYNVVNHIWTVSGRQDERTLQIFCNER